MSTDCTAKASYKKIAGLLELTSTHLQWTQDGKKAPAVRVAHTQVACAFDLDSFSSTFCVFFNTAFSFQLSFPQKRAQLKYALK